MKQLFTPILLLWACLVSIGLPAQTTTTADTPKKGKMSITLNHNKGDKADSMQAAITVIGIDSTGLDSLTVDTLWTDSAQADFSFRIKDEDDFPFNTLGASISKGALITIVSIIAVFSMPVLILFITFFFRYKNRKARYRLAEQALAAGQPLPEYILQEQNKATESTSQGIKKSFTGIGLFFFLWAITGEFGIGVIGILVMCQGIGQWIVGHRKQQAQLQKDQSAEKYAEEQ